MPKTRLRALSSRQGDGFGWAYGEEIEVDSKEAERLIAANEAEPLEDAEAKAAAEAKAKPKKSGPKKRTATAKPKTETATTD